MSFRKKSVIIGPTTAPTTTGPSASRTGDRALPPGVRPSPLDGRPTTSSGTASLDHVIAGAHAGMALGTSLLVEEHGTTDFSGVLARYYAAEGLVQGHHIHVLGYGAGWKAELPGLAAEGSDKAAKAAAAPATEQMKIAWRYEALGRAPSSRGNLPPSAVMGPGAGAFCHSFDLARRLDSRDMRGQMHAYPLPASPLASPSASPFIDLVSLLAARLEAAPPDSVHRVVVPGLLGPELYGRLPDCPPGQVVAFLHSLRALLHQQQQQQPGGRRATAMVTLSTSLFPRTSALVRWVELLSDGVLELTSLPAHNHNPPQAGLDLGSGPGVTIQGFARVHKISVYQERGIVSSETKAAFDNLSFRLSGTSGIEIAPYSLPPVGGVEPEKKKDKTKKPAMKGKAGRSDGGLEF